MLAFFSPPVILAVVAVSSALRMINTAYCHTPCYYIRPAEMCQGSFSIIFHIFLDFISVFRPFFRLSDANSHAGEMFPPIPGYSDVYLSSGQNNMEQTFQTETLS
jgi:hypothetical protein